LTSIPKYDFKGVENEGYCGNNSGSVGGGRVFEKSSKNKKSEMR
jgi:hypothetical protein